MSDLPGVNDIPDPADDDPATLQRLLIAEEEIEGLRVVLRSQEEMADRVGAARHALAQSQQELAQARQELATVRSATGWRGIARRVKRRIHRVPPPARSDASQADPVDGVALPGETEDFVWTDARYGLWVELYDTVNDEKRSSLLAQLDEIDQRPLVSIIFPVFNAPEDFLRQAIESVRAQLYTNWELCIADDCSTQPHVHKILDEYAALDARILVHKRETNGHISACSNSAVALASGTWLCLMDHDDVLAEHALAVAVLAIGRAPEAAIVYSDEDHIDADGRRGSPYFKPDFDPLLILGQNYFSHLCMLRAGLVEQVGGFREGYEGSQDWDLVLRSLEHVRPEQVVHIPHVLYHWRAHAASTASSVSAKPYVVEVSRLVVQEHLTRIGLSAEITTLWTSSFNRIHWALPPDPPKVTVIVLPRSGERLRRCIESIRILTPYPKLEIILADDGAFRPPMRALLRERVGWLTVIESTEDLSDSAQRNRAAKAASGEVLCFVADDIEVLTDAWLHEIVGTLQYPGIGCVGVKLLYPDLLVNHAGYVIGMGGTVGSPHRVAFHRLGSGYSVLLRLAHCPSAVSWACLAVRKDAFDEVGGFSEEHFTGMFGDVDLCLRLREAGWRTGWTPHAELIRHQLHDAGRMVGGADAVRFDRDIRYLRQRWGTWMEDDPAYNSNLTLAHESVSLAWPPRKSFA